MNDPIKNDLICKVLIKIFEVFSPTKISCIAARLFIKRCMVLDPVGTAEIHNEVVAGLAATKARYDAIINRYNSKRNEGVSADAEDQNN